MDCSMPLLEGLEDIYNISDVVAIGILETSWASSDCWETPSRFVKVRTTQLLKAPFSFPASALLSEQRDVCRAGSALVLYVRVDADSPDQCQSLTPGTSVVVAGDVEGIVPRECGLASSAPLLTSSHPWAVFRATPLVTNATSRLFISPIATVRLDTACLPEPIASQPWRISQNMLRFQAPGSKGVLGMRNDMAWVLWSLLAAIGIFSLGFGAMFVRNRVAGTLERRRRERHARRVLAYASSQRPAGGRDAGAEAQALLEPEDAAPEPPAPPARDGGEAMGPSAEAAEGGPLAGRALAGTATPTPGPGPHTPSSAPPPSSDALGDSTGNQPAYAPRRNDLGSHGPDP